MAERMIDARILIGGYDFTGHSNTVSLDYNVELLDRTVFGSSFRKRKPGLEDVSFSVSGYINSTQSGSTAQHDDRAWQMIGQSTAQNVSILADTSKGGLAHMANQVFSDYNLGGAVGDLLPFDLTGAGQARSPACIRGKVVASLSSSTSGASTGFNSTALNFGVSTSTRARMYASAHVVGFSTIANFKWHGILQVSASSGFSTAQSWINLFDVTTRATTHAGFWGTTIAPTTKTWMRVNWISSGAGGADPLTRWIVTAGMSTKDPR